MFVKIICVLLEGLKRYNGVHSIYISYRYLKDNCFPRLSEGHKIYLHTPCRGLRLLQKSFLWHGTKVRHQFSSHEEFENYIL